MKLTSHNTKRLMESWFENYLNVSKRLKWQWIPSTNLVKNMEYKVIEQMVLVFYLIYSCCTKMFSQFFRIKRRGEEKQIRKTDIFIVRTTMKSLNLYKSEFSVHKYTYIYFWNILSRIILINISNVDKNWEEHMSLITGKDKINFRQSFEFIRFNFKL